MTNTKMISRLLAAATLTAASMTAAYAVPQQEGAMAGVGTAATATDSALSKKSRLRCPTTKAWASPQPRAWSR